MAVGLAAIALVLGASAVVAVVPPSRASAATCVGEVGPGIPPPASIPAGIPGFHAAWYGQSGYQALCPSQVSTAIVAYYNSGSLGWVRGVMGQVAYLGTWEPEPGQDLPSVLGGDGALSSPATGWPRYNRVAVQPSDYVGPGQVAWFRFIIQAPATPGTYRLAIRPLVEGSTWMEDYGVFWVLTVKTADNAPPPPTTPPPASTPPVGDGAGFVGASTIGGSIDGSPLGVAEVNRFVATAGGAVTSLSIYLDAANRATGFELGLYADGSGAPATLLAKGAIPAVRNGAWNTVAIPSTTISAGSAYWIARLSTAGGALVTRVNPAVGNPDRTDTRSLTTLPTAFSPGDSFPHLTSMYAGTAASATPTPTPTPTPAPGSFTCTEVIGYSQTSNWYSVDVANAFEKAVVDARYQLRYELGAAVHFWADPSFGGWSGTPFSPCAAGSVAPDRVVMDVTEDFFINDGDPSHDRSQVLADVRAVVATIQQHYPAVRSIYLQPVVGGPGHTIQCSINGHLIRASANHPIIDSVIDQAVGGIVQRGPSPTVRSCADYIDDGLYVGHLTDAAKGPIGRSIGAFYATRP